MKEYGKTYEIDGASGSLLSWVGSVCTNDELRPMLSMIMHVDEKSAYCTDGRAMHVAELPIVTDSIGSRPIVEPGDYRLLNRSKRTVLIAKLEKDVFPAKAPNIIPKTVPTKKIHLSQDKSEIIAQLIFHFGKESCIGMVYLDKILKGYVWEAEYRNGEDKFQIMPIVFTSGAMKSVVMPRRSDWSEVHS
jgi:hypothetical protein